MGLRRILKLYCINLKGAANKEPISQLSISGICSLYDQGTRITHSLNYPFLLFVDNLQNLAREMVGI